MPVHLESLYLILSDVLLSSVVVRYGWGLGLVKLGYMLRLVDRDCQVDRCIGPMIVVRVHDNLCCMARARNTFPDAPGGTEIP